MNKIISFFALSFLFSSNFLFGTIEWGENHQIQEQKKQEVIQEEEQTFKENEQSGVSREQELETRGPEPYDGFEKSGGFSDRPYLEGFGNEEEVIDEPHGILEY